MSLIYFFLLINLDRVHIVRYEDICLKTSKEASDLLNFLDLSESELVDNYISNHTHIDGNVKEKDGWTYSGRTIGGKVEKIRTTYSTFRDSNSQAFEWRYHIDPNDIIEIQEECSEPMTRLGYRPMKNVSTNLYDNDYILLDSKPKELF